MGITVKMGATRFSYEVSGNRRSNLAHGTATVVEQRYLFENARRAHIVMITRKNGEYLDGRETHVAKHRLTAIGVLVRERMMERFVVALSRRRFFRVSLHRVALPLSDSSESRIPQNETHRTINWNCWQWRKGQRNNPPAIVETHD